MQAELGRCQGRHLNMLLGRGGSGGSQAAVARCRGDKLETGLERGVGYRSSVVRMARSYAGRLCCSASSADHAEMSGGMWGARLPESAATLSPMATASLEADPSTLVWGGLVELRLEVLLCRGTRSVALPTVPPETEPVVPTGTEGGFSGGLSLVEAAGMPVSDPPSASLNRRRVGSAVIFGSCSGSIFGSSVEQREEPRVLALQLASLRQLIKHERRAAAACLPTSTVDRRYVNK